MVDNMNLGFLVSDSEENFIIFMYQPESRESFGGKPSIICLSSVESVDSFCSKGETNWDNLQEHSFICFLFQGQKLLRKADYHLGQKVNAMFRIQCNQRQNMTSRNNLSYDKKHMVVFGKESILIITLRTFHNYFTLNPSYFGWWPRILSAIARKNISSSSYVAKRVVDT